MSLARLVRYKIKIALAGLTRGEPRRRAARIIGVSGVGAAVVVFAILASEIFGALGTIGPSGTAAAAAVVYLTFHALLVVAFVFDVATTTGIFFLSSDLGLLMAAPVPTARIFALKYLEAMAASSFVAVFIALPVVLGYGAGSHAPAFFYPAALGVTALFLSIPVSVGTVCGMLISRFIRAGRVRELLAILSGVIGLGTWIGLQLLKPAGSSISQIEDISSRVNAIASRGGLLNMLPSRLPAEIVTSLVSSDKAASLPPLAYLAGVSGALFVLSLLLARRIYLTGWARSVPVARSRRKPRRPGRHRLLPLLGWLPAAERSILGATGRVLVRDPQMMTPIATITIMMALFPFFVGRSGGFAAFKPALLLYSLAMLSFTGSMNLATSALLIHGRSFWYILMAPRSAPKKLAAHLAVGSWFFITLACLLVLAFRCTGAVGWLFAVKAMVLAACFSLAGSGTGLFLAVWLGNWEWDTPRRMLKSGGRLVGLGVAMAVFAAVGSVLGAFSGHRGTPLKGEPGWGALAAVAAVAVVLACLLLAASSARVKRMEWRF
jgi:hypothetical protein